LEKLKGWRITPRFSFGPLQCSETEKAILESKGGDWDRGRVTGRKSGASTENAGRKFLRSVINGKQ
jgi:hypothetical protein